MDTHADNQPPSDSAGAPGGVAIPHALDPDVGLLADTNPEVQVSDVQILRKAIEQRWPVTPQIRTAVVERATALLSHPNSRTATRAAALLASIEKQNQDDEHLREKHARIDAGQATEAIDHKLYAVEAAPLIEDV